MHKQKLSLFIFMFLSLAAFRVTGQISAVPGFTGCAPYSVILSGPPGASAVFWNFGSGMGTSTLSAPNPIYINQGNYNVTYTAIVGGQPVSYTAQVSVKTPPSGSFAVSIPPNHCAPMTASFSANASPGCLFSWAFGDLSTLGTGQTPTHTYVTGNSYVPVLTLVDAASGCTATASSGTTIHVSNPANLVIASSNSFVSCTAPFTTAIDGSASSGGSPLGGGLTYSWSFNTGSPPSSSAMTPGTISFSTGQHTITLQATDNNQCSTTTNSLVVIANPSLSINVAGTVCIWTPVPATITTNQNSVNWSIVGLSGSTGKLVTPNQPAAIDTLSIFNTPGSQTIILTVNPPGCPSYSISQVIFVEQVIPNYTWTPPNVFCQPSISVSYINQSVVNNSSSLSFTWEAFYPTADYNHGTPASSVIVGMGSPTFTFSQGSLNPYTMYTSFAPMITLIAESNSIAHCKSHISQIPYTIYRPTASFLTDKRQGCAPLDVKFSDYTTTHANYPVTSYTWCSGTPIPVFTSGTLTPPATIPSHNYTYTTPGTYYPYLMIQTAGGCFDTSFQDTITVVTPPQITANFTPLSACVGQSVTVNMSGTVTAAVPTYSVIDAWQVSTDNGFFFGCPNDATPTFSFTHPGTHTLVVTGSQAHCQASATLAPTIQIKGPVGKFQFETTCLGDKKEVKFKIYMEETSSALLDFGDGNQTTIPGNAFGPATAALTHTYPAAGDYTVQLTSTGITGCSPFPFQQVVRIRDVKANITWKGQPLPHLPQALACTKTAYDFSGENSSDHINYMKDHMYTWYYQSPTHTLAPFNGLKKDFKTRFIVVGPPPTTIALLVDPVALDTFRYAGTYTIGLSVKDINGCTDSVTRRFRISEAVPVFTFASNPACLSDGVKIINTTQNAQVHPDLISNYIWDFGDQSPVVTSTNPFFNPVHNYTYTPPPSFTLNIMCIATNTVGCTDTTIHKLQINNPTADFMSNTAYTCLPQNSYGSVGFTANQGYATYSISYGEPPSQPAWFSMGNFTNVSHAYYIPGTYQPSITIIDSDGCRTTETLTVMAIGQPTAGIVYPNGVNGFCRPAQPVLVSNSLPNIEPITNFIWSVGSVSNPPPGSPTLQASFILPVTTISLTVSMTSSLLCPHTATAQIFTYDPSASAIIQPTVFCLGDNISAGIQIDHDVAQWQWFFGDFVQQPMRFNTPLTPTAVSYPYTTFPTSGSNGNATVTLTYYATTNQNNTCKRTDLIPIRVIKVESDFKNQEDTYAHCLKLSDSFTNTAINFPELKLGYEWNFGDQGTGSGANYSHTYLQPGVYQVSLTVRDLDYGCKAGSVKQMTIFPLPSATITPRSLVCMSALFPIQGQASPGVSGIVTGTLTPAANSDPLIFSADNTFTVNASLSQSSEIFLTVTDDNNCVGTSSTVSVTVQQAAPHIEWDTTVVIGQPVPLNAFAGNGFSYTWTPLVSYLNCDTCHIYNPVSTTTMDITYSVSVEDGQQCSVVQNTYRIHMDVRASLDVPSAFTPNGDGINDIISPGGWGLRKLNYFRIFNRWGQVLFESNDLHTGWDGTYQGIAQNIETYVYQVSVETFSEKEPTLTKTGTFKLLR